VAFVNKQFETGPDGKTYAYDARANKWSPVLDHEWATPSPSAVPDKYWALKLAEARRSEVWYASAVALVPPAFVLALGSALVWAFRGFR
jgi:hypothetical protein